MEDHLPSAPQVRSDLARSDHSIDRYLRDQLEDIDLGELEGNLEESLTLIFSGLAQELAVAADDVEGQIAQLQVSAKTANSSMVGDMGKHLDRLDGVKDAVDAIKVEFDSASEGAVRIGDRLTTSVEEKRRLKYGIELVENINWLKSISPSEYEVRLTTDLDAIKRDALPEELSKRDWGYISLTLSDMRRVLHEISEDEAQNALKNVYRLSEHVEMELLNVLLEDLDDLMDRPNDKELIEKCKEVVKWLHLYNNGQTLVKRYVYTVIQKRMPESKFNYDAVLRSRDNTPRASAKDRESSATTFLSPLRGPSPGVTKTAKSTQDVRDSTGDLDYLSQLFATIQSVCVEQFKIVREIFPEPVIPKITRVLIQRIYNDPAFGIQGRVDAMLQPKPPSPPLPLADYLEYLSIVKEKLGGLYLMLLELFMEHSVSGIGKDNWSTLHAAISREISGGVFGTTAIGAASTAPLSTAGSQRAPQDSAEIEEFLQEQIMQVLSGYLGSYFDKEVLHLKNSFADTLRRAVDKNLNIISGISKAASSMVTVASGTQVPRLRAEKFGSMTELTETVANNYFLLAIEGLVTDSVLRMTNVGKEEHKLGTRLKDVYLLLLDFLAEGVMVPVLRSCANILSRSASRASNKGRDRIPPLEVLEILSIASATADKLKLTLESTVSRGLEGNANMMVVCREALKGSLKPLLAAEKEVLHAWNACIIQHVEYLLASLQNKSDYGVSFLNKANKNILGGGSKPKSNNERMNPANSGACDQVCQALLKAISAVRGADGTLSGLNTREYFWKPVGQQFVGVLVSHLRKQSITETGAAQLMHDLDEYHRIVLLFQSSEIEDMMCCLKEMCTVFSAPSNDVRKIIVEDLRHLDMVIVLALSKARSDYGTLQKGPDHWTRLVAGAYGMRSHRWDFNLPWEQAGRRFSRVGDSGGDADGKSLAGPVTLRKSAQPVSNLYMELLRGSQAPSSGPSAEGGDDEGEDRESMAAGLAAVRVAFSSATKGYSKPSFMPASPNTVAQGDNDGDKAILMNVEDDNPAPAGGTTMSSFLSSLGNISPMRETFSMNSNAEDTGDGGAQSAPQQGKQRQKSLRSTFRSFLGKDGGEGDQKKDSKGKGFFF